MRKICLGFVLLAFAGCSGSSDSSSSSTSTKVTNLTASSAASALPSSTQLAVGTANLITKSSSLSSSLSSTLHYADAGSTADAGDATTLNDAGYVASTDAGSCSDAGYTDAGSLTACDEGQIPTSGALPYEWKAEKLATRMNKAIAYEIDRLTTFLSDSATTCSNGTCTLSKTEGSVTWTTTVTATSDADAGTTTYAYTVVASRTSSSADDAGTVDADAGSDAGTTTTTTTILSGTVEATSTAGVGKGSFTMALGASHGFDNQAPESYGTLTVSYDNTSGISLQVEAQNALGVDDATTATMSFSYVGVSASDPTQGGVLTTSHTYPGVSSEDTFSVTAGWDSTGAGRVEGSIDNAEGLTFDAFDRQLQEHQSDRFAGDFTLTECWGAASCYYLEYLSVTSANSSSDAGTTTAFSVGSADDCSYSFDGGSTSTVDAGTTTSDADAGAADAG